MAQGAGDGRTLEAEYALEGDVALNRLLLSIACPGDFEMPQVVRFEMKRELDFFLNASKFTTQHFLYY